MQAVGPDAVGLASEGGAEGIAVQVLVLGAGGFIGSHLVERLLLDGHRVSAVDIETDKLEHIDGSLYDLHECDICDPGVERLVRSSDVVVDLVAHANPSVYVTEPLEVFDLNFRKNLDVVDQCVRHGKRLIQFSTAEVYGKASGAPCDEDASDLVLGPAHRQRWIYAAAKQLLERVIHAYGLRGQLDYTIVRPFNFVGSRLDYLVPAGARGGPRVFAHFMSALLTSGPMYLVSGGAQHRSFTHIDDAMDAFSVLLHQPAARNQIFNVGNPANNTSIRELAVLMQQLYTELTGELAGCQLVGISGDDFYGDGYDDADRDIPSIEKLARLGWLPTRDLHTTLRDAMSHYLADQRVRLIA
ncbi:MAG: bifunctional UDP-4-keto-pentose/UDP-xylose synthase [Acidimicrobiales bacterium]